MLNQRYLIIHELWSRLLKESIFNINYKLFFLGKSADLVCKVENGKEYPINWIKISGDKKEDYEYFPLSTGKTLAIRDQRFNLRYQHESFLNIYFNLFIPVTSP